MSCGEWRAEKKTAEPPRKPKKHELRRVAVSGLIEIVRNQLHDILALEARLPDILIL